MPFLSWSLEEQEKEIRNGYTVYDTFCLRISLDRIDPPAMLSRCYIAFVWYENPLRKAASGHSIGLIYF